MVVFLIIFHICMPIISVLKPTHLLICIHVLFFFIVAFSFYIFQLSVVNYHKCHTATFIFYYYIIRPKGFMCVMVLGK